jgi:NADPH:quinone reductase-like Zn-dependent oxidoreductase
MLTVFGHLARGSLRPVIDRMLPLADCAEGHRLLENRAVFGKVVLVP